jgi:hypothetical protein
MLRNSSVAERMSASQVGLSSRELIMSTPTQDTKRDSPSTRLLFLNKISTDYTAANTSQEVQVGIPTVIIYPRSDLSYTLSHDLEVSVIPIFLSTPYLK